VYQNKPADIPLLQDVRSIPSFLNGVRPNNIQDVEVPVEMDVGEKLYENRTIREKTWFALLGFSALSSYN